MTLKLVLVYNESILSKDANMALKELPEIINGVEVVKCMGMNNEKKRKRLAKFKCSCGNYFIAKVNAVKNGHRKSCGCARDGRPTHRLSKHPLYRKWSGMITRCENSNEHTWNRYGGRGISVCDEWRNDFMSFYSWAISNGWEEGLTIDRIDNDGNYEPLNCQWITMSENTIKDQLKFDPSKGVKHAIAYEYKTSKITVTELAKLYKTHKENISKILKEYGIKIDKRRRSKNGN